MYSIVSIEKKVSKLIIKAFRKYMLVLKKCLKLDYNSLEFTILLTACNIYYYVLLILFILLMKRDMIYYKDPFTNNIKLPEYVKKMYHWYIWYVKYKINNKQTLFIYKKCVTYIKYVNKYMNRYYNKNIYKSNIGFIIGDALNTRGKIMQVDCYLYLDKVYKKLYKNLSRYFPWFNYPLYNTSKNKVERFKYVTNYWPILINFLLEYEKYIKNKYIYYIYLAYVSCAYEYDLFLCTCDWKANDLMLYFVQKFSLKYNEYYYEILKQAFEHYILVRDSKSYEKFSILSIIYDARSL